MLFSSNFPIESSLTSIGAKSKTLLCGKVPLINLSTSEESYPKSFNPFGMLKVCIYSRMTSETIFPESASFAFLRLSFPDKTAAALRLRFCISGLVSAQIKNNEKIVKF